MGCKLEAEGSRLKAKVRRPVPHSEIN